MNYSFLNNILHHSRKDYQKSLPEHLYHFNNNIEVLESILQNNNPLKQGYGILWASHNANFWLDQDQDLEEATVIFDIYKYLVNADSIQASDIRLPCIDKLGDSVGGYKASLCNRLNFNVLCFSLEHSPYMINNKKYCDKNGFCLVFDSKRFLESLYFYIGNGTQRRFEDDYIIARKVIYQREEQEKETFRLFHEFNNGIKQEGIEYNEVPCTILNQFINIFMIDGLFMKREYNDQNYSFTDEKEFRLLINSISKQYYEEIDIDDLIPVQYSNKNPKKSINPNSFRTKNKEEACHVNVFFDLSSLIEIRCYCEDSYRKIEKILDGFHPKINIRLYDFNPAKNHLES